MKIRVAALCFAMSAMTAPGHAQEPSEEANGADLIARCQANSPECGAYLQGVLDMMIVARQDECGAPRYDRNRLRTAYLGWTARNSYFESVHKIAGAERALSEAWPCQTQKLSKP